MLALLALAAAPHAADLADELTRLVDVAHPVERRDAALALARRHPDVDAWLETITGWAPWSDVERGVHDERVLLWVGDELAECELHVYVPASYSTAAPAPLMVMLHDSGRGGASYADFWADVAEALGMLVLLPDGPDGVAPYAFTERERVPTLSALRWAQRRFRVDPDRVFLSGVSRGGHMAWDLALRHPDRWAALAPMIGGPRLFPQQGQNNLRYLENVAHVPIRQLQGMRDDPHLIANLRMAFARFERWRSPDARMVEFPELGHRFELDAVDWVEFLGAARRDPAPERIVRAFARPGEGRAHWLEILAADDGVAEDVTPRIAKARYDKMTVAEQKEAIQKAVDEKTARLDVKWKGPGNVHARGDGVTSYRVLLTREQLPARGPVRLRLNSKTQRVETAPGAEVLLVEFAERLDPTFLPVAAAVFEER